ncbi:MAG: CdaR family protein [Clostridia bacterium]|nr:CdaR family protein [Clostridia bacterium]MDD4798027.1 CdaR family protein [Clostridia bacterium]
MRAFFTENIKYKLIALLMALLLWIFVAQSQNSTAEQVYTVPITSMNLAGDLALTEQSEQIQVRLQGERQLLNSIDSTDITISCDFSDLSVGEHDLSVMASAPAGTKVVSVSPQEITVRLEKIESRTFTVQAKVNGKVESDAYQLLEPLVSPRDIVIYGPGSYLDSIEQVFVVPVIPSGQITSFSSRLPINVVSSLGSQVVSQLELVPATAEVFVPIVTDASSKLVAINVNTAGKPASGYQLSRIVLEPTFFEVFGNQAELQILNYLQTSVIDISGARGKIARDVTVDLPDGMSLAAENKVNVVLYLEEVTERTFSRSLVFKENVGAGLKSDVSSTSVSVRVAGPKSVIDGLEEAELVPYVDCAGLSAGNYTLKVKAHIPSSLSLISIAPAELTIEIAYE